MAVCVFVLDAVCAERILPSMKPARNLKRRLGLIAAIAFQASCGGDAAGPGESASSIAANSSTTLAAAPGSPVAELPSVVVRNQSGQPVAGAQVTFSVQSGGGNVTGGSATTNSSGIATVGSWTLGPLVGPNTLVARTGNLPPVTFTANAGDPCTNLMSHVLGSTSTGQLAAGDCDFGDGTFIDFYSFSIPASGTYVFTQTASGMNTYLWLASSTGGLLAFNDDVAGEANRSVIKAILPAGPFVLGANSFSPATGNYTLTSAASSAHVTACEDVFIVRGVSSEQSLQSSDCTLNGIFGDEYIIAIPAGQQVTVSMASIAVDAYLEIHQLGNLTIVASNDNADGSTTNAVVTFTPTTSRFYVIAARTQTAGATGAYTLTIQ